MELNLELASPGINHTPTSPKNAEKRSISKAILKKTLSRR